MPLEHAIDLKSLTHHFGCLFIARSHLNQQLMTLTSRRIVLVPFSVCNSWDPHCHIITQGKLTHVIVFVTIKKDMSKSMHGGHKLLQNIH